MTNDQLQKQSLSQFESNLIKNHQIEHQSVTLEQAFNSEKRQNKSQSPSKKHNTSSQPFTKLNENILQKQDQLSSLKSYSDYMTSEDEDQYSQTKSKEKSNKKSVQKIKKKNNTQEKTLGNTEEDMISEDQSSGDDDDQEEVYEIQKQDLVNEDNEAELANMQVEVVKMKGKAANHGEIQQDDEEDDIELTQDKKLNINTQQNINEDTEDDQLDSSPAKKSANDQANNQDKSSQHSKKLVLPKMTPKQLAKQKLQAELEQIEKDKQQNQQWKQEVLQRYGNDYHPSDLSHLTPLKIASGKASSSRKLRQSLKQQQQQNSSKSKKEKGQSQKQKESLSTRQEEKEEQILQELKGKGYKYISKVDAFRLFKKKKKPTEGEEVKDYFFACHLQGLRQNMKNLKRFKDAKIDNEFDKSDTKRELKRAVISFFKHDMFGYKLERRQFYDAPIPVHGYDDDEMFDLKPHVNERQCTNLAQKEMVQVTNKLNDKYVPISSMQPFTSIIENMHFSFYHIQKRELKQLEQKRKQAQQQQRQQLQEKQKQQQLNKESDNQGKVRLRDNLQPVLKDGSQNATGDLNENMILYDSVQQVLNQQNQTDTQSTFLFTNEYNMQTSQYLTANPQGVSGSNGQDGQGSQLPVISNQYLKQHQIKNSTTGSAALNKQLAAMNLQQQYILQDNVVPHSHQSFLIQQIENKNRASSKLIMAENSAFKNTGKKSIIEPNASSNALNPNQFQMKQSVLEKYQMDSSNRIKDRLQFNHSLDRQHQHNSISPLLPGGTQIQNGQTIINDNNTGNQELSPRDVSQQNQNLKTQPLKQINPKLVFNNGVQNPQSVSKQAPQTISMQQQMMMKSPHLVMQPNQQDQSNLSQIRNSNHGLAHLGTQDYGLQTGSTTANTSEQGNLMGNHQVQEMLSKQLQHYQKQHQLITQQINQCRQKITEEQMQAQAQNQMVYNSNFQFQESLNLKNQQQQQSLSNQASQKASEIVNTFSQIQTTQTNLKHSRMVKQIEKLPQVIHQSMPLTSVTATNTSRNPLTTVNGTGNQQQSQNLVPYIYKDMNTGRYNSHNLKMNLNLAAGMGNQDFNLLVPQFNSTNTQHSNHKDNHQQQDHRNSLGASKESDAQQKEYLQMSMKRGKNGNQRVSINNHGTNNDIIDQNSSQKISQSAKRKPNSQSNRNNGVHNYSENNKQQLFQQQTQQIRQMHNVNQKDDKRILNILNAGVDSVSKITNSASEKQKDKQLSTKFAEQQQRQQNSVSNKNELRISHNSSKKKENSENLSKTDTSAVQQMRKSYNKYKDALGVGGHENLGGESDSQVSSTLNNSLNAQQQKLQKITQINKEIMNLQSNWNLGTSNGRNDVPSEFKKQGSQQRSGGQMLSNKQYGKNLNDSSLIKNQGDKQQQVSQLNTDVSFDPLINYTTTQQVPQQLQLQSKIAKEGLNHYQKQRSSPSNLTKKQSIFSTLSNQSIAQQQQNQAIKAVNTKLMSNNINLNKHGQSVTSPSNQQQQQSSSTSRQQNYAHVIPAQTPLESTSQKQKSQAQQQFNQRNLSVSKNDSLQIRMEDVKEFEQLRLLLVDYNVFKRKTKNSLPMQGGGAGSNINQSQQLAHEQQQQLLAMHQQQQQQKASEKQAQDIM